MLRTKGWLGLSLGTCPFAHQSMHLAALRPGYTETRSHSIGEDFDGGDGDVRCTGCPSSTPSWRAGERSSQRATRAARRDKEDPAAHGPRSTGHVLAAPRSMSNCAGEMPRAGGHFIAAGIVGIAASIAVPE